MTILAVAGVALMAQLREVLDTVQRVQRSDLEWRRADRLLSAVTLWSRRELDERLGARVQGSYQLRIERLAGSMYQVQLTDSLGNRLLLESTLFRPESTDAPR